MNEFMNEYMQEAKEEYRERVIKVFLSLWGKHYRMAEKYTGIPAARWKNLCVKSQYPTIEMLLALAKYKPNLCQWMLTGNTDSIAQVNLPNHEIQKAAEEMKEISDRLIKLASDLNSASN